VQIDEKFSLRELLTKIKGEHLEELNKRFNEMELDSIASFANNYAPNYIREDGSGYNEEAYFEHGLTSSLLMCSIYSLYEFLADILLKNPGICATPVVKLLRLAFLVGSKNDDHMLSFETHEIINEICIAVALHNFYPEHHRGKQKKFRIDLRSNPFIYLCALTDGLQKWDREKQFEQSKRELPFTIYGNMFNLETHNDEIHITLHGKGLNIKEEDSLLRGYLPTYLAGTTGLVKLDLSELF
jgi:hypothetical protein